MGGLDIVIADAQVTLQEIEATNCKLPQRLEKLQVQWREQKSSIDNWMSYFQCIGVSLSTFSSETAWIADCVSRAAAKGPKYGGGKGEGKGKVVARVEAKVGVEDERIWLVSHSLAGV